MNKATRMTPSEQVPRKTSLVQDIASRVRDAIITAELSFGESLSEEILAEAFEVSRTPVREALNLLQMEGLVTIVPKSGTYVYTPTVEGIGQLVTFRGLLEAGAVRMIPAADRPAIAARLSSLCDAMDAAIARGDIRDYGAADTEFHLALVNGSGNTHLTGAYAMILGRVASLRTHLALKTEGEPQRSFEDHRLIAELIARDTETDRLARLLTDHIDRTRENYVRAFRIAMEPAGLKMKRRLKLS